MRTLFLSIFINAFIFNSFLKSQNYFDDFENYPVGASINGLNPRFSTAQSTVQITDEVAVSGKQALLIKSDGNSLVPIFKFNNGSEIIKVEYKIKKVKSETISVGLNWLFPHIKMRGDEAMTIYLNNEYGPISYDGGAWNKVSYIIDKRYKYFSVYLNDKVFAIGNYDVNTFLDISINLYQATRAYIDDLSYEELTASALENDLGIYGFNIKNFNFTGKTSQQSISVINLGSNSIDTIEVVKIYDGIEERQLIPDVNLSSGETFNIELQKINHKSGKHPLSIEVKAWNRFDQAKDNNSVIMDIYGLDIQNRKLLFEYITGTWCGYCPANTISERKLNEAFGNDHFNSVYVHVNDVMEISNYILPNIDGVPSLFINRDLQQSVFHDEYSILKQLSTAAPLTVETKVRIEGNKLYGESSINLLESFDDYIYHAYIILEDSVRGTTNAYNQANFYSGDSTSGMQEFIDLPPTILASKMVYRNVARYVVNGLYGLKAPFTSFEKDNTYTMESVLPFSVDKLKDNYYIISIIFDKNRKIINSDKKRMKDVLYTINSADDEVSNPLYIFPNPTQDYVNIVNKSPFSKVQLLNVNGQVLKEQNGDRIDVTELPKGLYFISVENKYNRELIKFTKI